MPETFVPLHPKIIHFPVALFISALIFYIFSFLSQQETFYKTALHLYIFATLTVPFAFLSGLWEIQRITLNHPTLDKHHFFATCIMWGSLASLPGLWICEKICVKYFKMIFFICLIGGVILVSMCAHKGGQMVYLYGVGIEE